MLAAAVARALLDGPWVEEEMRARVVASLRSDASWVRAVVRVVLSRWAEPPHDDHEGLIAFLGGLPRVRRRERSAWVVQFATPSPRMGPTRWDVPALGTIGELASWLEVGVEHLEHLAGLRHGGARASRYTYEWREKRFGLRLLERPSWALRAVQRRVLHGILDAIPPHEAAHGFRRGRSVASHAAPHAGKRVVLALDLEDFFASIPAGRVFGVFRTAGYPAPVARVLAGLCSNRLPPAVWAARPRVEDDWALGRRLASRHLPQGAPTSPALEEGFRLNTRKTRVMKRGARQRITGVVVNERVNTPRAGYDRLRAALHEAALGGAVTEELRAHLLGRISWHASLNARRGE